VQVRASLLVLGTAAALLWAGGIARAQVFPADASSAWVPLTRDGIQIQDANGDILSSGGRNIVGAPPVDQPSVLVAADASFLYFRVRVDTAPTSANTTWACELDVDDDPTVYEYYVGYFAGASASIQVQTWFNSGRIPGTGAEATSLLAGHSGTTYHNVHTTTIGPTDNWWMSWAIPRGDFNQPGYTVDGSTPLRLTGGTVSDGKAHLIASASADIAGDGSASDPLACGDAGCASVLGVAPPASFGPGLVVVQPNPAHGGVAIRFGLPHPSPVTLEVHDLQGRWIATVTRGDWGAGMHAVTWSGRDDRGAAVAPGLYFVRLSAGTLAWQRRLVVLR
jgi:hypothetical protein